MEIFGDAKGPNLMAADTGSTLSEVKAEWRRAFETSHLV